MANSAKGSTRRISRHVQRRKSGFAWTLTPLRLAVLVLALVVLGGAGLFGYSGLRKQATSSPNASDLAAPAHRAEVGKPAPAFALNDPYGQTYTLQPGDGKAHVLVFYMGYF